jgi:hypothetical protein
MESVNSITGITQVNTVLQELNKIILLGYKPNAESSIGQDQNKT